MHDMPKKKLECIGDPDVELFDQGYSIIGIDEAGRGPIAGPMFVGIVHFSDASCAELGLKDSKRFSSEKKRCAVDAKIRKHSWNYDVVRIPVSDIESAINLNDLFDQYTAENVLHGSVNGNSWAARYIKVNKIRVLVDGNRKIKGIPQDIQICRPKLDATSWHVAAASILAKTAQTRYMESLAKKNPQYGFDKHHGYGTKAHFEAIKMYGFLDEHRKSWVKPEKMV